MTIFTRWAYEIQGDSIRLRGIRNQLPRALAFRIVAEFQPDSKHLSIII